MIQAPGVQVLRAGRFIPQADVARSAISGAQSAADHVRSRSHRVSNQMSIFYAISIASSTSMPRYRTVLSIFANAQAKVGQPGSSHPAVDQHRLRAAQGVRAELRRVEPNAGHPLLHKPRILPRRQAARATVVATGNRNWPDFRPVNLRYSSIACRD